MEQIYLKGTPRTWHSTNLDLRKHFKKYIEAYEHIIKKRNISVKAIMDELYQNVSLNTKDFNNLARLTHEDQLKPFIEVPIKKCNLTKTYSSYISTNKNIRKFAGGKKKKNAVVYVPNFQMASKKVNPEDNEVNCESEIKNNSNSESILDKRKDLIQCVEYSNDPQNISSQSNEGRIQQNSAEEDKAKCPKFKEHIILNTSELLLKPDLYPTKNLRKGKHFIVSFRIHEPYLCYEKGRIGHFIQEICVLDFQTLDFLRDKIICQWDFQDGKGEVSETPDTPVTQLAKDLYTSAMFYIDNTFYVDCRYKSNIDYSLVIKKWARERGIPLGKTLDMRMMPVGNLKVRFGYPYVYIHQGCCEHLVIINDARLVTGKDPLSSQNYPMITKIPRHLTQTCMICSTTSARWAVTDSERMLYDISYLCETCLKRFHYNKGKKIGNFEAYRYNPVASLL